MVAWLEAKLLRGMTLIGGDLHQSVRVLIPEPLPDRHIAKRLRVPEYMMVNLKALLRL